MGSDTSGLGRWIWIRLYEKNVTTRVIVAYEPCVMRKKPQVQQLSNNADTGNNKIIVNVQGNFCKQLTEELKNWRAEGEPLILLIDTN